MRRLNLILSVFLFTALLSSCASTVVAKKASLVQGPERMFWRIQGYDAKGKPATVYVQATIHVGDDRLYPLAKSVDKAFDTADRVAGEVSSEGWAAFAKETQRHLIQSYIDADGRNVYDRLSDTQKQTVYTILDQATAEQFAQFEPWALNSTVSSYVYFNSGLSSDKAMDTYFITRANNAKKNMEGLDTLDTQFAVLQFGTYDEQVMLLQDTLDSIADSKEVDTMTNKLYEAYLAGNVKKVAEIITEEDTNDIAKSDLYARYYKAMLTDRNSVWADKIKTWLAEGGSTFIFAGSAHFVGNDSVFFYLKQNGTLR